jgi:hypothetical protein
VITDERAETGGENLGQFRYWHRMQVNSKTPYIIDEHTSTNLGNAYPWTSGYSDVRVASDNYYNTGVIDTITLLAQHIERGR